MSNSVWPHRRQPTRLPCPWDSAGKNTGVGGHFLLQCMKVKVKLLSRVWLLVTTWTAAYRAPPSMGFSRQEYWSGVPLPSPSLCIIGSIFIHLIRTDSNAFLNHWVVFHCVYIPQLFYPLICEWASMLLSCLSYCKQCCDEYWGTCVSLNSGFFTVYA